MSAKQIYQFNLFYCLQWNCCTVLREQKPEKHTLRFIREKKLSQESIHPSISPFFLLLTRINIPCFHTCTRTSFPTGSQLPFKPLGRERRKNLNRKNERKSVFECFPFSSSLDAYYNDNEGEDTNHEGQSHDMKVRWTEMTSIDPRPNHPPLL